MRPGSSFEAGVHSALGRDVSLLPHGHGVLVPCNGPCGKTHTIETRRAIPPAGLRRNLEHAGWSLARKRLCPDCNRQEKPMPTPDKPPLSAVPSSPTPDAFAMRRAVMEALLMAYDADAHRYSEGYDDARIAKETGAAPEFVAKFREENVGPIGPPSEFAGLQEKAMELVGRARDLGQDIALLRVELSDAAKRNGWK